MNTPRHIFPALASLNLDMGRTTLTERILELTGQIKREEGEKTDWKSPENCTPQPTVGQRHASKLISSILLK